MNGVVVDREVAVEGVFLNQKSRRNLLDNRIGRLSESVHLVGQFALQRERNRLSYVTFRSFVGKRRLHSFDHFISTMFAKIPRFMAFRHRFAACFVLASLSLLSCRSIVLAAEVTITEVEAGFDDHFKIGRWAPVSFTLKSNDDINEVTPRIKTIDPDGHTVIVDLPAISLKSGQQTRLNSEFRSGRDQAPILIEILAGERVLASRTLRSDSEGTLVSMQQRHELWLISGEQPAYQAAAVRANAAHNGAIHIASLEGFSDWAASARALDTVDLIVINGDTQISEAASESIRQWVSRGGRLVIAVGEDSKKIQDSPLNQWLPMTPRGTIDLRNLDGLHTFISGSSRLLMRASVPGADIDVRNGRVIASGLNRPLITRAAYGLGSVGMLAVRLDIPVLAKWGSGSDLAMILAGMKPLWNDPEFLPQQGGSDLSSSGISDFQTQIIEAIDQSQQVNRLSYWSSMGWMALLAILIGPIDYYLVHRVLKRPQLTWITLPIWLGVIAVWTLNSATLRNDQPLTMRQMEVIDFDATTDVARGWSWSNLYSPETRRYDVTASIELNDEANGDAKFIQTSWADRPESGYRGMYRRGGFDSQLASYKLGEQNQSLEELPVRVWSTRTISSEWETPINASKLIQSSLVDKGTGRLQGEITHSLPTAIDNWFIAYGNFAYLPRTQSGEETQPLNAGEVFRVDKGRSNILRGVLIRLRGFMTEGQVETKKDTHLSRESYDPFSTNAYDIFRILSFHDVTGGSEYSGLTNQSLAELSLTTQLELGRAVLFGSIETPVTKFEINGEEPTFERQQTVVRIILPVDVRERNLSAPPEKELLEIK